MAMMARIGWLLALVAAPCGPQRAPETPPPHTQESPLFAGSDKQAAALADGGITIDYNRNPARELEEHRRLDRALVALQPQRPGVVDAYVLTVALDSDPVFSREAREAARVLARRYDAEGRTITLAGADARGGAALAMGSPAALDIALARIAEVMDVREDALVLYTTSHGAPAGIVYNDGDAGFGAISPKRLAAALAQLRIANRLLMVSACYSGVFVRRLATDTTAILTASSADRSSFGCQADNDWTFFGDALVNHALRKPQPLAAAAAEAGGLIQGWERQGKLKASQPQVSIGTGAARWLAALDARAPAAATDPVGQPAASLLQP